MKSPGTRHRFMAALMISSQVLLTAFVVYWLAGQYREERLILHEQLKKEYLQVHDNLADSLLMENLVIPSLDDSIVVRIHGKTTGQTPDWVDSSGTRIERQKHMEEIPREIQLRTLHVDGSVPDDSIERSINVTSVISDEERMVKSVKLFINQNQDVFQIDSGMYIIAMIPDSSSLLLNMELVLEARNWKFVLDWPEQDPGNAALKKSRGILLNGGSKNFLPVLRVEYFNAFLFRSIFPQILFSLILLVLSGSALLFAYRSLRRQLILNRLRDDFISNISHELKTPVSTVKVALEALLSYDRQKDPKVSGEYLEIASKELDRLERLVGKVLHHQMLNNPSLVLEKEDCNLGKLARSVVRTLDIAIRERGARVTILDEQGPCHVPGDRVYLEGMIMNLIDNSLKYSGSRPEILIKIECNTSGTILSVSDKGPGIPEEYKDQVFEKFFRLPTENRHNVKGYGLGLNFASQVMARHGGTISFNNLPEGGCCFTLQFPETEE